MFERFLPTNAADLLALPINVRGLRLLQVLVTAEDTKDDWNWVHSTNLLNPPSWNGRGIDDLGRYLRGISEAWAWLIGEGLLAVRPDKSSSDAYFVTQRGRSLVAAPNMVERLNAEARLRVELHPAIGERIRAQYLLGETEMAAFAAMREIEIRVRALSGADDSLIGVKLIRQAFGNNGPLRHADRDGSEEDARMNLYLGAIGLFKNPSSHRAVDYSDPLVASEVILLADLLLRLLDRENPA